MCTQLAAAIYSPDEANMPKWSVKIYCRQTPINMPTHPFTSAIAMAGIRRCESLTIIRRIAIAQ